MTETPDTELDEILEAAASWHTRLDLGTADQRAFEAWRDADHRHAAAFARMEGTDGAVVRVRHRIEGEVDEFEVTPPQVTRRRWLAGGLTGVGAVVLGGGGLFAAMNRHAHAETRVGERQCLTLPDGGRLEINTDTKLSWNWDGRRKKIWLKRGEIAVAAPASLDSVTVHALGYEIGLGGSEVNVRIRGDSLEVTCLKGIVQIIHTAPVKRDPNVVIEEAAPPELKAGQAFFSASYDVKTLKNTELQSIEAWQSDEMLFTGQTLAAIVAEYNRYLTKKIVIRDPSLSSIRLGGRFNVHSTADFLASLRDGFGVRVTDTGQSIELSR